MSGLLVLAMAFSLVVPSAVVLADDPPTPPPNDDFADAIEWDTFIAEPPAPVSGTLWSGTLVGATVEADEPGPAGMTRSIWYRIAAGASVLAVSSDLGSGPLVGVLYEGDSLDDLTVVPMFDDGFGVEMANLTPGLTYSFQVGGPAEVPVTGNFFYLWQPPPNDAFATPLALPDSGSFQGSLIAATRESGEPGPTDCPSSPKTSWFTITPATAGQLDLTLTGPFNTFAPPPCLTLYGGDSLAGLTELATATASGATAHLSRNLAAGTTYRIAIAGGSLSNPGHDLATYFLQWGLTAHPPNDDFADAIEWDTFIAEPPAPVSGTLWSGTLVGATVEADEPGPAGMTRSIWYRIAAGASVLAVSSDLGSGPLVGVLYEGDSLDDLTVVPMFDDGFGVEMANLTPGLTYSFQVGGPAEVPVTGNFFYLWQPPPNDAFATPLALPDSGSFQGSLIAATRESGEPGPTDCPSSPKTSWFTITPATAGQLDLTLTGPFNTFAPPPCLTLYGGDSLAGLTELATATASGATAHLSRNLAAGTTYRIAIAGGSLSNPGHDLATYFLQWGLTAHPPNDDFADAIEWDTFIAEPPAPVSGTLWSGTLVGATVEADEPGPAGMTRSIWYRIAAGASVLAVSSDLGSGPLVGVLYEGDSLDDLTVVPMFDDGFGVEMANLTPGLTYSFQVGGPAEVPVTGNFFYLWQPPPNDAFATPLALPDSGSFQGSLIAATRESGEPGPTDCPSSPKTSWFTITPATAGQLDLTLTGPFNTFAPPPCLTLYGGDSLAGLTELATATASGATAHLSRNLAAGTTYRIAIAGGSLSNPGHDLATYFLQWGLTAHPNQPPSVADATLTVAEDGSLSAGVAVSDPDGDPLIVAIGTPPAHGQVVLGTAHDGVQPFTYTPDPNYHGPDSFTITADDGEFIATGTVSITVTPENDPPDAVDDDAATTVGVPVTIDLTADDSDVDGDDVAIDSVGQGAHGSVVIIVPAGGSPTSVTYTPAAGFAGNDQFSYVVTDGVGGTDTAVVDVVVADVTAPVLTLPADIEVTTSSASGVAVTFIASATDDVDTSPTVTCAPPSGSTFPVGQTTVACSSTDAAGNTRTGTFKVTVVRPATMLLTVTVTQDGAASQPAGALGTVSSAPAGINACPSKTTCSTPMPTDAVVTLTAAPKPGGYFRAWVGCGTASGYVCTVTMAAARSVTAQFSTSPPATQFRIVGAGIVATSPAGPTTIILDASRYTNGTWSVSGSFLVGGSTYGSLGLTSISRSGSVIQMTGTARKVAAGTQPTLVWTLTITDNRLPNADKAQFTLATTGGSVIASTGAARSVLGAFIVTP